MSGMSNKTAYEKIHVGVGEKGGRAESIWLQVPSGEVWVFLLPLSVGEIALQQLCDSILLLPTVVGTRG